MMRILCFSFLSIIISYLYIYIGYTFFAEDKSLMGMVMVMEAVFIVPASILNGIFLEFSNDFKNKIHSIIYGNIIFLIVIMIFFYNPFMLSNSTFVLLVSLLITNTIWFLLRKLKS